ncbi:hypothetical protein MKEN_00570500 [Mycena kentingensis (nom. inval.)]|nr:hypothetical protein MKEN_00570500 [Mycena kentingensis (nom. inval.)]
MPQCEFCKEWKSTAFGVTSHQAQSPHCRAKQAAIEAKKRRDAQTLAAAASMPDAMDLDPPTYNPPMDNIPPPADSRRARVEDVEDMGDPVSFYDPREVHIQQYPAERRAGERKRRVTETEYEAQLRRSRESGGQPWGPWASMDEWDLGRWIMSAGLSQAKIDEFLHLKIVRDKLALSFKTTRAFLKKIDQLPCGPAWCCTPHDVPGPERDENGEPRSIEYLELWHRNILECIATLIGNPALAEHTSYEPIRIFRERDGTNREYDEMWTGTWWWDTQGALGDGATIIPIILSSDKTQLSTFAGDKQAWPVYITIGNISKEIRRQPSAHATMLLGYIPIPKLNHFPKSQRQFVAYQVFHDCMRTMVKPLVRAGQRGCRYGVLGPLDERGSTTPYPLRTQTSTLNAMSAMSLGIDSSEFERLKLRPVKPYWEDLPYCDIHAAMTPDLLHQLHKGVFADHVSKWATQAMNGSEDGRKKELDARFRSLPRHPTLRHFSNGTSVIKQWTGSEYRNLSKVFLGAIHDAVDPDVVAATRHLLDFMSYAHFEVHTDESLDAMDASLHAMHSYLPIFEQLGIREHFDISKLHNIWHTAPSIRSRGTADGFNTEHFERLHIDLAKNGYRASNRRDYTRQMTRWLTRQEAVHHFSRYLESAVPGYRPGHGFVPSAAAAAESVEDEEEEAEEEEEMTEEEQEHRTTYTIAKRPAYANLSAEVIETRFGVRDFLYYVEEFIEKRDIPQLTPLSTTSRFHGFKQATLHLPSFRAAPSHSLDTIHAILPTAGSLSNAGIKRGSAAKFSTVLVRVGEHNWKEGPLSGLRAAHIKLIFRLPEEVADLEHPLVYVHWFTPFRADPSRDFETPSGFNRVAPSTSQGQRRFGSCFPC